MLAHLGCSHGNGQYVKQTDGQLKCDHCGRTLMAAIDLPACVITDETDPILDRIASLVHRILRVPIALVTLVDQLHQVFVGADGLRDGSSRRTPLSASFCQLVVMSAAPLIIADTSLEPLVQEPLAETDLVVRAYAGFPIYDLDDRVVGTVCAIDDDVHNWSPGELDLLQDFAAVASAEVRGRDTLRAVQEALDRRRRGE